jgi:hypothetical protein
MSSISSTFTPVLTKLDNTVFSAWNYGSNLVGGGAKRSRGSKKRNNRRRRFNKTRVSKNSRRRH